jgi:hypothetical protein
LCRGRDAPGAPQRAREVEARPLCQPDQGEEFAPRLGRERLDRLFQPTPLIAFESGEIDPIGDKDGQGRCRSGRARRFPADAQILNHRALVAVTAARGFGDGESVGDVQRLKHRAIVSALCRS